MTFPPPCVRLVRTLLGALLLGVAQEATCGSAPETLRIEDVAIDNAVSRCLVVTPARIEVAHNVVLLLVDARHIDSTAACGCKSALLSYSVVEAQGGRADGQPLEYERGYGVVSAASLEQPSRPFALVLASDRAVADPHRKFRVRISCKAPD